MRHWFVNGRCSRSIAFAMTTLLLSACGGGDGDDGSSSGPPASNLRGLYVGSFNLTLSAPGTTVSSTTTVGVSVNINKSGAVRVNVGGDTLTGGIAGNRIQAKSTLRFNFNGGRCSGPEVVRGTVTPNQVTGTYRYDGSCSATGGAEFRIIGTGRFTAPRRSPAATRALISEGEIRQVARSIARRLSIQ